MGWVTDLFCNIVFNRKTYNSKYEVESDFEELDKLINATVRRLTDLAIMTEPNKFFTDPDLDILSSISTEVRDQLEELEEYYIERYKLSLLLEYWDDCHNEDGLAINPPDNIDWKTAYLDGDFVKTVKRPNEEII